MKSDSRPAPAPTGPPHEFLTPKELSERWKISLMSLSRWRKQSKIPTLTIGRRIRFRLSDVIAIEEQNLR